jgi:hypothetical protein
VIRAAIDKYSAENEGALPGANGDADTFKGQVAKYLRGADFPTCPVGAPKNNEVYMMAGNGPVSSSGTAQTHSWLYKYETGDFHVNSVETSGDGVTYDKF